MTPIEIQTKLREFIVQQFPAAASKEIGPHDSLIKHGIIDSLGVLEIVTFVEQQFAIVLSDDEMVSEHFESIASLAEFIQSKRVPEASCNS